MPPKRRNTRAAKKAASEESEKSTGKIDNKSDVQEPPVKKQRGKGRPKKNETSVIVENAENASKAGVGAADLSKADISFQKKDTSPNSILGDTSVFSKKDTTTKKISQKSVKKASPTNSQKLESWKLSSSALPVPSSPTKSPIKGLASKLPSLSRSSHAPKSSVQTLDSKKAESLIGQAFLAKSVPKLTSIIEDLSTSKADKLFDDLKSSLDARTKATDDLIATLTSKNEELSLQLQGARERIAELGQGTTLNGATNDRTEEVEYQNELILDMMEQVVGLRIHHVEDIDATLSFTCSQSGKNGILDYKLIISKEDSSEIMYEPLNAKEEMPDLKKFLPDYFFDYLTFPLDTLQQFYHKIYRGLNK